MTTPTRPGPSDALVSEAYEITVDGGRDTFCALSIERESSEDEWLISDTVYALENMQ